MFAGLLMLGVIANVVRMSDSITLDSAPSDLGAELALLGARIVGTTPSGVSAVAFPGCANLVTVGQMGFDGQGSTSFDAPQATDSTRRYAYLGFVSSRLNLMAIAGRWAIASAQQVFGLRRGSPSETMVFVMIPKSCPDLAKIDWSVLSPWD
jgi:hypothetical protein